MTLRDLVKEYRKAHGLSQRQFASICGLSNGYISMLEKNLNPKTGLPLVHSFPTLQKLTSGMGITMNELFQQVEDVPVALPPIGEEPPYSDEAMSLAKDYDDLDSHGQRMLRLVADEEKARCEEEEGLQYAANKRKADRPKARKAEGTQLTDDQAKAALEAIQSLDDPDPRS